MSESIYDFTIRRDSTIPEHRDLTIRRLQAIVASLPDSVADQRAACYLRGWALGLMLGEFLGVGDVDDVKELLPEIPTEIINSIPYGHADVTHPEVDALGDDAFPAPLWFGDWVGIKNEQYYYAREGKPIPELEVLCWLGFLLGSLETGRIPQENYDTLRALLPPVSDDFTPLVAATK